MLDTGMVTYSVQLVAGAVARGLCVKANVHARLLSDVMLR
jgi:hypothetical protein